MERRLILTIALSLLVLLTWSALVSRFYHVDKPIVTEKAQKITEPAPPLQNSNPILSKQAPVTDSLITLDRPNFKITFIEPLSAIKEVEFTNYQFYRFPLKYGLALGDQNLIFKKEKLLNNGVTFIYRDKDKQITKRIIFHNSNYTIELEIEIQNLTSSPFNINYPLILGVLDFTGDQTEARFQDVTVSANGKISHLNGHKDINLSGLDFLGLRNRYFCAIIEPLAKNDYNMWIRKINNQESEIGINLNNFVLDSGQQRLEKFRIYLGPQDLKLISSIKPEWSSIMYFGVFNLISHILLDVLNFIYNLLHNWGLAIIILSTLIYFLFYPLSLKQMRSMKQMQALQPQIDTLRKTYKDNPQKLNKEIMELYRKQGVNPFSGCLPLLLQIPVFFALYQALIRAIALKGAKFLWIKDLSLPDRLFMLNAFGKEIEINILPILMTIGMFIQQKISMTTTTSASAEQQKLMLIMFPLMFGFIFYRMPSGLVLYWFINSSLMLAYQLRATKPPQRQDANGLRRLPSVTCL